MSNFLPPEGFIYDDRTGYFYTQEIERDIDGKLIQHVIWFDPESGEFSNQSYDIPDDSDSGYVDDEYEDELDDEFQIQNQDMFNTSVRSRQTSVNNKSLNKKTGGGKEVKKASAAVIIGIVGVVVLAAIVIAVVLISKKNEKSDKYIEKDSDIKTENVSDIDDLDLTGVNVDSHDYIKTSGKSPLDCNISEYNVVITSSNDSSFGGMYVEGMGDMTGEFLVNPSDRETGDPIYSWDFFFSDKIGIRVYGMADCQDVSSPKYVAGDELLKAAIVSREGNDYFIQNELPLYVEQDGISVGGFNIKDYDENIEPYYITTVGMTVMMGNYWENGDISITTIAEDGTVISYGVNYNYAGESVMTDGVVEEAALDESQEMGSGVDLHSSGMSGFKHPGGFECTDNSLAADVLPKINLDDDGYCELYANMGDGFYKLQGYYEYKDAGEETYIYMYFPSNSDNLSYAELIYDNAIEGGYIYFLTEGFGLMGGDENYAGYFVRIY